MRPGGIAAAATVVLAVSVATVVVRWPPAAVVVPPGVPVAAVADAHPGAVLELAPGRHAPFTLTGAVTVRGREGAVVDGPVEVRGDGARLEHLVVRGGDTAVTVRGAEGVTLDEVVVTGAASHGIAVVDAAAVVTGCRIGGLTSDYAQGVEVRNANGRPRTVVSGCLVDGGREGVVAHVSRVEFRDNRVTGTTLRAIVITEMSEGLAERNVVRGATGAAFVCGDVSHCVFRDNTAEGVRPDGSGVRSNAGWGAAAMFYSTMQLDGNVFDVDAPGAVLVQDDSSLAARPPLDIWPVGWRGVLPALPIATAAVAGLAVLRATLTPVARRMPRRRGRATALASAALLGAVAVQTFHTFEHAVQVWQVYAADAEVRSGLVGQAVDTEWLHLGFNAAVLGLIALAWTLPRVSAWLLAATVAQGVHVAEHVARVIQYLDVGVHPAPGLLGGRLGLVWFHFAINVAVLAGAALAVRGAGLVGASGGLVGTPRPQTT